MHACEMTLAYLRGGLSTCSVVWVRLRCFSLKFIKVLMQLCKNFFDNSKNHGSYLPFQEPFTLAQPFSASVALVCDFGSQSKNDDYPRSFVIFSDLTS